GKILGQGLEHADASSIQYWIEAVVHGLGFRRLVETLTRKLKTHPRGVIFARYYLPVKMATTPRAREALHAFDKAIADAVWNDPELPRVLGEPYMEGLRQRYSPENVSSRERVRAGA